MLMDNVFQLVLIDKEIVLPVKLINQDVKLVPLDLLLITWEDVKKFHNVLLMIFVLPVVKMIPHNVVLVQKHIL